MEAPTKPFAEEIDKVCEKYGYSNWDIEVGPTKDGRDMGWHVLVGNIYRKNGIKEDAVYL